MSAEADRSILFVLDGRPVEITEEATTQTLLWWLRRTVQQIGTKEGCAEGDCGACTVAVQDVDHQGRATFRAINSCLLLLPMLHGRRLWTVEGLRARSAPGGRHPAQVAMAEELGSQCGYCTPGFVMSLFEATYREDLDEAWKLDDQIAGNLCRCTGYRPIRDALGRVAGTRPDDRFRRDLEGERSTPRALDYTDPEGRRFVRPTSLDALWDLLDEVPGARFLSGSTDLGLEVTKRHATWPCLISTGGLQELRGIESLGGGDFSVGAAVPLADVEAWALEACPPLARMLRYFGARQIKHGGTLGGNLCNASPIGDTPPILLALGATIVLRSREGERRVPIEEFFLGYRQPDLRPSELLVRVEVPAIPEDARVGAYKVSKRRELDISAVAAGLLVRVDEAGVVTEARLGFGGMAATPKRATATETALVGQPWTLAAVEAATGALKTDFTPMSDHRGSAWYRSTVAKNLLVGFYLETHGDPMPDLIDRPSGTVLTSGPVGVSSS